MTSFASLNQDVRRRLGALYRASPLASIGASRAGGEEVFRPQLVAQLEWVLPKALYGLFLLTLLATGRNWPEYAQQLAAVLAGAATASLLRHGDKKAEGTFHYLWDAGVLKGSQQHVLAEIASAFKKASWVTTVATVTLFNATIWTKRGLGALPTHSVRCPDHLIQSLAHALDFRWIYTRLPPFPPVIKASAGANVGIGILHGWAYIIYVLDLIVMGVAGFLAGRLLVIVWGISRLGRHHDLEMQPWHPDKSGGLRPLGDLSLSCAAVTVIPSVYFGFYCLLAHADATFPILWMLLGVSLMWSAFTFWLPLSGIHRAMSVERQRIERQLVEWSNQIEESRRLLVLNRATEFDQSERLKQNLQRLEELYQRSNAFPLWPVDWTLVGKLVTIQLPALIGLVATVGKLRP